MFTKFSQNFNRIQIYLILLLNLKFNYKLREIIQTILNTSLELIISKKNNLSLILVCNLKKVTHP